MARPIVILTLAACVAGYGQQSDSSSMASISSAAAPMQFDVTLIEAVASHSATFQSHNQKVVANVGGIFLTYLTKRSEVTGDEWSTWRLMRSTDGGETFTIVREGTNGTLAPVLETDEAGNIYMAHPDWNEGAEPFNQHSPFYFYRFAAENDYKDPQITQIPDGPCAAKFAMTYDRGRQQFYIATQYGQLITVGPDGKLRQSQRVLKPQGDSAATQYPSLCMDTTGRLHHAWTSSKHYVERNRYVYWDIHTVVSPDGGQTWTKLDGKRLDIPVPPDESGPTDRITLDDEFIRSTWLANSLAKGAKLHFAYQTKGGGRHAKRSPERNNYRCYDLASGKLDVDHSPDFGGESLRVGGGSGFFATRAEQAGSPLYYVTSDGQGYIICLVSMDNGTTWHDYARSNEPMSIYALGGCREVTDDGYIIGSFTVLTNRMDTESEGMTKAYFLRIPAAGMSDCRQKPSKF